MRHSSRFCLQCQGDGVRPRRSSRRDRLCHLMRAGGGGWVGAIRTCYKVAARRPSGFLAHRPGSHPSISAATPVVDIWGPNMASCSGEGAALPPLAFHRLNFATNPHAIAHRNSPFWPIPNATFDAPVSNVRGHPYALRAPAVTETFAFEA